MTLIDHASAWLSHRNLPHKCPTCGTTQWVLHRDLIAPPVLEERTDRLLRVTERVYPMVAYQCLTCTGVVLFSLHGMGLMQDL